MDCSELFLTVRKGTQVVSPGSCLSDTDFKLFVKKTQKEPLNLPPLLPKKVREACVRDGPLGLI